MSEPEVLLAALCDDVRHELSGKVSLMGIFDTFNVAAYTAPLPPFHIYAKIAVQAEGPHPMTLRIQSEEEDFKTELGGQMQTQGRDELTQRHVANIDLAINGLTIPRPGKYRVTFVIAGHELFHSAFLARTAIPPNLQ
jgi:hypothetical protein